MRAEDSVILVANHRSFFDFYVVSAMIYWRTRLPRRVLFPVRADFFYDHPAGVALNFVIANMAMFPPVLRDPKRRAFNRYSVARCVAELATPGTVMGLHPEGTRNKGDDPYSLLPAQPGVGQVVLGAPRARVFPVFLHGVTNDIFAELADNWRRPDERPIDIWFGPRDPLRGPARARRPAGDPEGRGRPLPRWHPRARRGAPRAARRPRRGGSRRRRARASLLIDQGPRAPGARGG
ncbi:MAG: 1-acyl-sn-glycerol-3-phosphate acyltransferase [Sandaracinaceae bacterium]|nr:1-acyl-sn-glycerol-3-phosphate acyltransferase [Sandaracinaceae bacterium]